MATKKREASSSSTLVKEKGTSLSNLKPSPRKPSSSSSTASGSSEKQVPNYLKPTKSSRTETALKASKKHGTEDPSQNSHVLRRRSLDKPPSAARTNKALVAPVPIRPKTTTAATSSSRSSASKPVVAAKTPSERVFRKPNAATKPHAPTLSSSRSSNKSSPITSTKARRGSSTSRKPQSCPDRKEAVSVETKHGNKENLDYQVEPEARLVVKDDQGEEVDTKTSKACQGEAENSETPKVDQIEADDSITSKSDQSRVDANHATITSKADQCEVDDTNVPNAEESDNAESEAVLVNEDTTQVTGVADIGAEAVTIEEDTTQVTRVVDERNTTQVSSVFDKAGQDTADISSTVSEQQNEPDTSSAILEQQNEPDTSSAISEQQNESAEPEPQTEKVEYQVEEVKSDHMMQHGNGYKESQIQEEIIVGDDPRQEKTPCKDQELTTKTRQEREEHATEEMGATREAEDEKQPESRPQEDNEESKQQGLESSMKETVQELGAEQMAEVKVKTEPKMETKTEVKTDPKMETKTEVKTEPKMETKTEVKAEPKTTNAVSKSQVQGKKGPATPYNNVIEQTASKLVRERRNKVKALVGAFETVIDQETSNAK